MNTLVPRMTALAACLLLAATADAASARRLAVDGRVSGEITGADRLNLNDGSRSVSFELDLTEGQAIALEGSAVFCGRAALFSSDDGGREMLVRNFEAECSEDDGRKVLTQTLVVPRTGRYTLAFGGRSGSDYGPFSLALKKIELQADRDLVAGDDVHGLLDAAEKELGLKITEAGRYELELLSSEFDPLLRLRGQGVERENDDNGENYNSRLIAYLQPGDYRLQVARVGEQGGMYQLRVKRSDVVLPAGVSMQNDGDLAAGELAGLLQGGSNTYRLVVAARSRVGFALESSEVDPRIVVTGPGTALTDDDSGEGTNAHLVATFEPGTYSVVIDDVGEADAGMYRLRTSMTPAAGAALRVRPGTPVRGDLVAAEMHRYKLTVDRAGQYTIGMSSTELDSVLHLVRDGEIVETNDDAAEGDTNAKLDVTLVPGEYEVIATSYDGGNGSYQLEVARR
jgi:hypothetical protein